MLLTDIQIRKKGLYALYFDCLPQIENAELEKQNVLLINRGTFDLTGYKKGCTIGDEELQNLVNRSDCERACSKAMWLLNYHDSTAKAMKNRLRREFSDAAAEYAVQRCCELHIIDDVRYAERNAEILVKNKNMPKRQAVYKLIEKGVERDTAENAVEGIDVDIQGQLDEIIRKKYALRLHDQADIKRATTALMRKGFPFSEIKRAIEKYTDCDVYEGEN